MQTNDHSVCCRMCFPSGVHSFTSPNGFYSVYDVCILNALFVCTNGFYSVYDVCILNLQFVCPNGFYSVYELCILNAQFKSTNVFYVMRYHQFRKRQRFLFCLSPYLFSEWHIVPQLCIQIKQSRVHSRKALYE